VRASASSAAARPRRGGAWQPALAALCLAWPAAALGHGLHFPKRDTLTVRPGRLTLAIRLDFDAGAESMSIRDRFDRNADGHVGEEELGPLEGYLVSEARRPVRLRVDGAPLDVIVTAKAVYGLEGGTRGPEPVGVDVVLEGPLPMSGQVRVDLSDHGRDLLHQVPLSLRTQGATIDASSEGRLDGETNGIETLEGIYLDPAETFSATLMLRDR
jgi:hypothetical protein